MDLSNWTIVGGIAVIILLGLRAWLTFGKRSGGGRKSARQRQIDEMRRRYEAKHGKPFPQEPTPQAPRPEEPQARQTRPQEPSDEA